MSNTQSHKNNSVKFRKRSNFRLNIYIQSCNLTHISYDIYLHYMMKSLTQQKLNQSSCWQQLEAFMLIESLVKSFIVIIFFDNLQCALLRLIISFLNPDRLKGNFSSLNRSMNLIWRKIHFASLLQLVLSFHSDLMESRS